MKPQHHELNDIYWRLNNLYYCVTEEGKCLKFRMNDTQKSFFHDMWWRNEITKARQRGFTTFICILGLDFALFNDNKTIGFIAHKGAEATKIYQKKILYPYDRLPTQIQKGRETDIRQSAGGHVTFINGSNINVGLSFRSDTCQFLHISEFGKICASYPSRAEEIITGSIPTVHRGGRIFIESTTEGAYGHFYDIAQAAHQRQLRGDTLTYLNFKHHFYPWWEDKRYCLNKTEAKNTTITAKQNKYFRETETAIGQKLTRGQRAWYVSIKEIQKDKMFQEYPATFEEAFKTVTKGAYYKKEIDKAYADGRIGDYPPIPGVPVYTFWDLGMGHDQAIWGIQIVGGMFRAVFFYKASGEGLKHYVDVLKDTGFGFEEHWGPHDIAVREWTSGQSRIETAAKEYDIRFYTVPNISFDDGIDAVRRVFPHCLFHEQAVKHGIADLSAYQREFDEKRGCFRSKPLQNSAVDGADAFRYFAVTKGNMALKQEKKSAAVPEEEDVWAGVGV